MALYPTGTAHDVAARNLVSQPRFTYAVDYTVEPALSTGRPAPFAFDWWYGVGHPNADPAKNDPLNITGANGEANGKGSTLIDPQPETSLGTKVYAVTVGAAPWGFIRTRLGDTDNPVPYGSTLAMWIQYNAPDPVAVSVDYVGGTLGATGVLPATSGWQWGLLRLVLPAHPGGTIAPADAIRPVLTLAAGKREFKFARIRVDFAGTGVDGYFDGDTPAHAPVTFSWAKPGGRSITRATHAVPLLTELGHNLVRQPRFTPTDTSGDPTLAAGWSGNGTIATNANPGGQVTHVLGNFTGEVSTTLTDTIQPGIAVKVWIRYRATNSHGLTVGLRYDKQSGDKREVVLPATGVDEKTDGWHSESFMLTMPTNPRNTDADPITEFTTYLYVVPDPGVGDVGIAYVRADVASSTLDQYFDGDTKDTATPATTEFDWLGIDLHSESVALQLRAATVTPPTGGGTGTGGTGGTAGSGTGGTGGTGTGGTGGTGSGSGTTIPGAGANTGAVVERLENAGYPQRTPDHTAFVPPIASLTPPVKGSLLFFVYDGPTPEAGYHQGFCFGVFIFDGTEWQYQTPHDPHGGAHDPPTSELDALGTAVVGAFYNLSRAAAIGMQWKAPANSYIVAWPEDDGVRIRTYHAGDASYDREILCPYPTGVTRADMPGSRVFRSELPADTSTGGPVLPVVTVPWDPNTVGPPAIEGEPIGPEENPDAPVITDPDVTDPDVVAGTIDGTAPGVPGLGIPVGVRPSGRPPVHHGGKPDPAWGYEDMSWVFTSGNHHPGTGGSLPGDTQFAPVTMPAPRTFGKLTAQNVADTLGRPKDPVVLQLAADALVLLTEIARGYTGGRGFENWVGDPNEQIGAVIILGSCRLVANPEQIETHVGSVKTIGAWSGWSLAELAVLNRYRVRFT